MNKKEIIELLNSNGKELYRAADETRQKYKGNKVHLRGLIEFSNFCKRNCAYCGLLCSNKKLERYRLNPDEIFQIAKKGAGLGYKTVVLQSGEDDFYTEKIICNTVEKIKELNLAVTLSIGEKSCNEYKAYKKAGADRYLLRVETTDENLYKKLHKGYTLENRIKCLYNLKELGYETGTGSIAGLPGQTINSIADDILFYKKLNADMVGIGPFIPHPNTPLKSELNPYNFDLSLKMTAITRLILPDINIPATTAMETINENGRLIALNSGANVVMPNLTATKYRAKYEIYPNKICLNDDADKCRMCIEAKIKSIGREISSSFGFRHE